MNVRIARRPLALLTMLGLALAGCREVPRPLEGARLGGPFALTDQDGRPATAQRFAGRYRIFYFGYTFCPDVCPTTLQTLMAGYHRFAARDAAAARRLVPVFVTVDPRRDTPAVLQDYVAAFGPELVGLTGSAAEIDRVAREYGVYYKAQEPGRGASGYLVDHSNQAILYGPEGKPIALVPTEQGADAVARTLAQWVR